jgi:hypothetical protein
VLIASFYVATPSSWTLMCAKVQRAVERRGGEKTALEDRLEKAARAASNQASFSMHKFLDLMDAVVHKLCKIRTPVSMGNESTSAFCRVMDEEFMRMRVCMVYCTDDGDDHLSDLQLAGVCMDELALLEALNPTTCGRDEDTDVERMVQRVGMAMANRRNSTPTTEELAFLRMFFTQDASVPHPNNVRVKPGLARRARSMLRGPLMEAHRELRIRAMRLEDEEGV